MWPASENPTWDYTIRMLVYCLGEHCSSFKDYGIYASLSQMLAAYRCGEWEPVLCFTKNYMSSVFKHMHVWCIVCPASSSQSQYIKLICGIFQIILILNPAVNSNLKVHFAFYFFFKTPVMSKRVTISKKFTNSESKHNFLHWQGKVKYLHSLSALKLNREQLTPPQVVQTTPTIMYPHHSSYSM